jgi:hypothetical protein
MVKRTLQTIFLVFFIAGMITAQTGTGNKVIGGVLYDIPKTTVAPTIDGLVDQVWKTLDWNFQRSYTNGAGAPDSWADLCGASKLMYDDENLYGLFYSQDDVIDDDHTNSWERDNIEIYTDADNSKGDAFDTIDDQHLTFQHGFMGTEESHIVDLGFLTGSPTEGVEFMFADDETTMGGFWLEFKIPLDALQLSGDSTIGLELQQDDNDGVDREHVSKWWLLEGDNSWQVPNTWGTAQLSTNPVSEVFNINKLPAGQTITVDGEFDAIWGQTSVITQNSHGNGAGYPTDFMDALVRTYLTYDDNNLYVYFDVNDDILDDDHANSWERDNVEIYTDADNSKGEAFDTIDDQHLTIQHGWIGDEAANVVNLGFLTGSPTEGVEFYITEDDLGYNVEMVIPLDALALSEGSEIGLEIQQDDNDGADREHVTKWWLETGDNSWQVPSTWGTAILGPAFVPIVDVEDNPVTPTTFALAQNYPNPFNPTTKITYTIAQPGLVNVTVYNIFGEQVAVLVNDVKGAGEYSVDFNAKNLASGVYFYRMETGNISLVKKMMLLK